MLEEWSDKYDHIQKDLLQAQINLRNSQSVHDETVKQKDERIDVIQAEKMALNDLIAGSHLLNKPVNPK
jgi:hypothetical protein